MTDRSRSKSQVIRPVKRKQEEQRKYKRIETIVDEESERERVQCSLQARKVKIKQDTSNLSLLVYDFMKYNGTKKKKKKKRQRVEEEKEKKRKKKKRENE